MTENNDNKERQERRDPDKELPKYNLTWKKYIKTLIPWLVIGLGLSYYFSR